MEQIGKVVKMPTVISEEQSNNLEEEKTLKEVRRYTQNAEEHNIEEFTDEKIRERCINAGISKRHLDADINNIAKNIIDDMKGFANKESFYVYGDVGCGKTYLISALIKEYFKNTKYKVGIRNMQYGYKHVYMQCPLEPHLISVPDLLLKIRLTFKENSEYTETDIIKEFTDENMLILDDIGVEKSTEWVLQTLYTIIDRRNRNMKQTIFTSNYTIKGLKERIGERIASRIVELCGKNNILNLKGKDKRL